MPDGTLKLSRRAQRATALGVIANTVLAAVKGLAGVLGNSHALLADAMESFLDVISSVVVLGSLRIAAAPPDENHPYGHGKAEPLAAFVVALAMVAAALGLAIRSVSEIRTESAVPASYTLVVLVLVILVKEGLYRSVSRVGKKVGSRAVINDAWHHRSDAITSVAALIGISIAIAGGPAYSSADDWAALFACGIIAYNGIQLMRPALDEVMDARVDPDIEKNVRAVASAVEGVAGLDSCTVRKMGFEYFVDLHVEVDGNMTVRDGHEVAHQVKDTILGRYPRIRDVLIHIEPNPDLRR